jgi:hypothetical protein
MLRILAPPASASRRCGCAAAALTATPPPASKALFSIVRATAKEAMMHQFLTSGPAANDVYDELVAGLEIELGVRDVDAVAARWIEAEAADFYWQCRIEERALGSYHSLENEGSDLELTAVLGQLHRRWYVAWLVVDGDGEVQDLLQVRQFLSRSSAGETFDRVR